MLHTAVVWDDCERWILQPGGWRDQWGYLYAGYDTVNEVVEGKYRVVDGIGCDISHYRRLAL